jgi:hypothetical protein
MVLVNRKRLADAKLKAFDDAYGDTIGIQNTILPDNENFTDEDAAKWEQSLLIKNNTDDLEIRKERIVQKLFYPNGVLERSTAEFMQQQLQALGFNVYVIENRFWNGSEYQVEDPDLISTKDAALGLGNLGQFGLGSELAGIDYTRIIANFINEDLDNEFFNTPFVTPPVLGTKGLGDIALGGQTANQLDREIQLQGSLFIGGPSYPSFASVDKDREEEFIQTILKFKPVQTICFAYINFN